VIANLTSDLIGSRQIFLHLHFL